MEDFISFKTAKKLKENGYPFNTFYHYDIDGQVIVHLCDYDELCEYPIPEIHQALKWLRDKKNIICLPHIDAFEEKWFFYITILPQPGHFPVETSPSIYDSYESAALAGIEYVVDNLI